MQTVSMTNEQGMKTTGKSTLSWNYAPMLQAMKQARSQCYIPRKHPKINRQLRRLEVTLSHTKQTSATRSNRNKTRFSPSDSLILRLAQAHRAKGPKSLQPRASSLQPLELLIANEFQSQNAAFSRPARFPRHPRAPQLRTPGIAAQSASSNVHWRPK